MLIYPTQITKKGTTMKYSSALISIIFSMTIFSQEYPDMPDIPEELRGKMPMSKMFGMKEEKEFESIEEFLEDGEYELIDGFLKIYKETDAKEGRLKGKVIFQITDRRERPSIRPDSSISEGIVRK